MLIIFHCHYLLGAGDLQFHIKRILELKEDIYHGDTLPLYALNKAHGSAVLSLYPYINLLPIFLLSFFVKSNIMLLYLFFLITTFLSFLISYYSSLSVNRHRLCSLIFSIIYTLSTPFVTYEFYDMDLGVLTSIVIFPLIIFGFINLINNNKWVGLALGITVVIFSHVINSLIIIVFLGIWLIINYRSITNRIIICIFKIITLAVLLTSIVWVPAIHLIITNLGNILPPGTQPLQGTNFSTLLINGLFGNVTYALGLFSLIGIIAPLFCYKRLNIYVKQMYILSIAIILICSNIFPWMITNYSIFRLFRIFQYTWRLYFIPEMLLSYIFSVCITECVPKLKFKYITCVISIFLVILLQLMCQNIIVNNNIYAPSFSAEYVNKEKSHQEVGILGRKVLLNFIHIKLFPQSYYRNPGYPYYKISNDHQLNRLSDTYTNKDAPDYYPISSIPKLNYINNDEAFSDKKTINFKHCGYNQFSFNNNKYTKRLTLPIVHYNSENLRIISSHNHHLIHYHISKNSLVQINDMNKGYHEIIIYNVHNDFIMLITLILFMSGIIWLIYMLWIDKCSKRN